MSIIGTTINWGEDQPVELPPEDRRRHVYVIGQTGTGKTTLLRNLILQDIHEGRGVGFIDPHGDVAEVGYEDAEILAAHFHPSGPNAMAPHAFSDLAQYEAWARLMRYGEVSDPMRIKTLLRLAFSYGGRDTLIQHSRDRFATRRTVMEGKINQWMRH